MSDHQGSTVLLEFIAGCVAGFSKIYSGQPFDIVKVRLQSMTGSAKPSPLAIASDIIKNEGGVRALWKGSLPPLLGVGLMASIQFGVNENVKKAFIRKNGGAKMTNDQLFIAGGLAGLANTIVSASAEHFRIRIQTQPRDNPIYKGSIDCMKQIYGNYGIRGVYKGLVPTLFRDGIGYAVYFMMYSNLLSLFAPGEARRDIHLAKIGAAGSLSGILLWTSAFPFDVIKTRIQTDNLKTPQYSSMKDAFVKTYQAQGIKAFYKGYIPCFFRAIPVNGIVFMLYEFLHRTFIDKVPTKKLALAV